MALSKLWSANPSCFRLFWHCIRAAAARTFWTAGNNRPIRIAIMAITTSNSMSVKGLGVGRFSWWRHGRGRVTWGGVKGLI